MPNRGRYPHPRICRKFTREGGAVSARHTKGSDHPLPSTPRPARRAHRPARRLSQSKAVNCARPATSPEQSGKVLWVGGLFQSKVRKSSGLVDFRRAKSKSPVPGWTLPEQSGKVCPPGTSPEQSPKAEPGGGVPARRKKTGFFSAFFPGLTRMYKEARPSFSEKKKLTFRPAGVIDVRAGRETAQKAHPGGREKPPPGERSTPHENPDLRHRD